MVSAQLLSSHYPKVSDYKPFNEQIIDTAYNYIGTHETSYNSSHIIDKMIRRGGGKPGWSWCMYYVYYCVDQAAIAAKKENPLLRTGAVWRQLRHAKQSYGAGRLEVIYPNESYKKVKPQRGDIIIMKYRGGYSKRDLDQSWNGHTGFVIENYDRDKSLTIEGNTNDKGSREGDGVYRKVRWNYPRGGKLNTVAFIRIIDSKTDKQ